MPVQFGSLNTAALVPYVHDYGVFLGMVGAAAVLRATPLGKPFGWAETFYHELSHALVCKLTFGRVGRLYLFWRGGGKMTYGGGWRIPVAFAGYAGASCWGALLYLVGWLLQDGAVQWLYVELGVLLAATVLWVRNLQTLLIMGILFGVYAGGLYLPRAWMGPVLEFVGIYVMLNAIEAPLHLIDGRSDVGDGAALQRLTLVVPEGVWILLWLAIAVGALATCAVLTLPGMGVVVGYLKLLLV